MRVFLPTTRAGLAALQASGRLPGPLAGHAVTARLVAAWPDEEDEGRDYAALMAAAFDSLVLLAGTGETRRIVLAVEVPLDQVRGAGTDEVTAVVVAGPLALDQLASVHLDHVDAEPAVDEALRQLPAATGGDAGALAVVALEDHELLWYARQEIPDLLA